MSLLDQLQQQCGGRLDASAWVAEKAEKVVVDGSERWLLVEEESGQGVALVWSRTLWLVRNSDCRSVGFVEEGGEGSLFTSFSFTTCPDEAEKQFLLERAGYVREEGLSLESILPTESGFTSEKTVGDLLLRAEGSFPPAWHAGTPPTSFAAYWKEEAGNCPSYSVHHTERLRHMTREMAGGILHSYVDFRLSNRNGEPESHSIFEDTRRHQWSFIPDQSGGEEIRGSTPFKLRHWRWSQQAAFMDPGIPRIVACEKNGFECVSLDLRIGKDWPDHLLWGANGLLVYPSEPDNSPVFVPSSILLEMMLAPN